MNMIPNIAKSFGVEIGEKFHVWNKNGKYYIIGGKKIQFYFDDQALKGSDITTCNKVLSYLLNGTYEVVKKKLKPEPGDTYWRILFGDIDDSFWNGDIIDLTYYVAGNCFKTKKEALENSKASSKDCRTNMKKNKILYETT